MRKSHEERTREIIQSALELASEEGVKKVTTQAIAERVGIAQPTVFRHFRSRDEIFAAAIGWLAERLFSRLDRALDVDMPADRRLQAMIETQLGFVARNKGLPRMLFSDRLHQESPALKKTVQQVMERYTARVAAVIAEGQQAGLFRAELDALETARFLVGAVQGLIMRWSIHDFGFSLEAEADPLWRFLRAGLRGERP